MSTELPWFLEVSLTAMGVCLVVVMVRLLRGPTLPDRVVALDLLAVIGVGALGLLAHAYDSPAFLDIAGTLALIAFVSTIAFARYLERKTLG